MMFVPMLYAGVAVQTAWLGAFAFGCWWVAEVSL